MPASEKAVTALTDLEVNEVSFVDRPANLRKLLVIKNAGDQMPDDALEQAKETPAPVKVEQGKKPAFLEDKEAKEAKEKKKAEKEKADDPVVAAQAGKAAEGTSLIVSMDDTTKSAFVETLKAMATRLGALSEAVSAAKSDTGGTTSEKLTGEIISVSQSLGRLANTEKAEIIQGMAKGHFPGMDDSIPQLSMTGPMEMTSDGPVMRLPVEMARPMTAQYAQQVIQRAADQLYGPDYDFGACIGGLVSAIKALGPFVPEPVMQQYAFNQPQPSYPAGVPDSKPPQGVKKTINPGGLDRIEDLLGTLGTSVEKSAGAEEPYLTNEQAKQLVKLAKSQHEQLAANRSARPVGHASRVGDNSNPRESTKKVTWPDDLNAPDQVDVF